MATLRTYSKKTPRVAAPLFTPAAKAADWDELDAIISEDDGRTSLGKRKEDFAGKENTANTFNQILNYVDTRPTKKVATTTKNNNVTPTKPLTPRKQTPTKHVLTPSSPSVAKTPTKALQTPTKSPKTPTKSPKTPTKLESPNIPKKSPKSPKQATPPKPPKQSPIKRNEDTRALRDELDYLVDGMDSPEHDIRRESMYKLGIEFRKGLSSGPVGQVLRHDDGVIIQRIVDVLLLRWDRFFFKDKASYLHAAVILHALARDPANIPHLSRCQTLLLDIVFSSAPQACRDDIENQAVTFILNCGSFAAHDDYTSIGGDRNEFQIASSMAVRTLAALSFTRTVTDSLRQSGIVGAVVQLVSRWVDKMSNPAQSFMLTTRTRTRTRTQTHTRTQTGEIIDGVPFVDVPAMLDIKYALIILENATFVNPENQNTILEKDCFFIHTLVKLITITRDIILFPETRMGQTEAHCSVTLIDAATDCMIGCLKLLLNLTYNHYNACETVRLACVNNFAYNSGTHKPTKNTKAKKRNYINSDNDTTNEHVENSLGGIAVLLSLLNIQFDEDMFDIHQHVIGLLINLVETNPLNRREVGSIDGAIPKIISLFLEQKAIEEQKAQSKRTNNAGIAGAAYCAMLLGWLAHDSPDNVVKIRCAFPPVCDFSSLAALLKLFMSFQLQAGILPDDAQKSLIEVIKVLEML